MGRENKKNDVDLTFTLKKKSAEKPLNISRTENSQKEKRGENKK